MTPTEVSSVPKLPVWRTVGQAYAMWFRHFPELVRMSWIWLLLIAPVVAVTTWLQIPPLTEGVRAAVTHGQFPEGFRLSSALWSLLNWLISLPAAASIAVAWHRLLLRDEHLAHSTYLRFDKIVVGYAMLASIIVLIGRAPNVLSITLRGMEHGTSVTVVITSIATGVISMVTAYCVGRLSLALPARALSRKISFHTVWQATKANGWRLVVAHLLCILPWTVPSGFVGYFVSMFEQSRIVSTLMLLITHLSWLLFGMVSIGLLSLSYRHFFERSAGMASE